ncbi:MAG: DUF4398 domain-containing protein [Treponema sp.]|jgi:hypothetical protein|nr:DUF4398 domain-containing protein [Treponema sp.]
MKFVQNSLICVLLVSLAVMSGCAKPPTEEMGKAVEAVARAENDPDAVNYAGNLVTRAKDALALMQQEADAKRYDAAKNYANEAITTAERAINEGRAAALRIKDQAASLVSELPPLLMETEQGIDAAKAAKLALDYNSVDREFTSAQRNTDQAQLALSSSRYQDAISLSNTVRAGLNGINQQLSNAAMAVSRKK